MVGLPQQLVDVGAERALGVEPFAAARLLGENDFFFDGRWPTVEDENFVGQVNGFVDVVGHKQGGFAELAAHGGEPVLHVAASDDVESAKGLVQKQDVGVAERRAQEGRALAHAAGKLVGVGVFIALKAKDRKQGAGFFLRLGFLLVDGAVETNVIHDGFPRQEQVFLWHVGEVFARLAQRLVVHGDAAALWRNNTGENVEDGAFAAAAGAENADELAFLDTKGNVRENGLAVKGGRQPVDV